VATEVSMRRGPWSKFGHPGRKTYSSGSPRPRLQRLRKEKGDYGHAAPKGTAAQLPGQIIGKGLVVNRHDGVINYKPMVRGGKVFPKICCSKEQEPSRKGPGAV